MTWVNELGQLSMRDPRAIAIVVIVWTVVITAVWFGVGRNKHER